MPGGCAKRPVEYDCGNDPEIQVVVAVEIADISRRVHSRTRKRIPRIGRPLDCFWNVDVQCEVPLLESTYEEVVIIGLTRSNRRQFPSSERCPSNRRQTTKCDARDRHAPPYRRCHKQLIAEDIGRREANGVSVSTWRNEITTIEGPNSSTRVGHESKVFCCKPS